MTTTNEDDAVRTLPASGDSQTRRRSTRWVLADVAAVAAAGAAAWVFIGAHPALDNGPLGMSETGREASIYEGHFVTAGAAGEQQHAVTSVRYAGRVPLTILGVDSAAVDPSLPLSSTFAGLSESGVVIGSAEHAVRNEITLAEGESAALRLTLHVSDETACGRDCTRTVSTVPLRVRQLGITTTQTLQLIPPIAVVAPADFAAATAPGSDGTGQ